MTQSVSGFLDHILIPYRAPVHSVAGTRHPSHPMPVFVGSPGYVGHGSGRQTHVHVADPLMMHQMRRYDEEDRQRSRENTAAVLGGLATIVFAGLSAFAGKSYMNAKKELEIAIGVRDYKLPTEPERVRNELTPILNKHIEILQEKVFFSKVIIVLTGLTLGCAIAAFGGGMFSMPALITGAIVGVVGCAAIGAFAAVWHLMSDRQLSPEMVRTIEQIRAQYPR